MVPSECFQRWVETSRDASSTSVYSSEAPSSPHTLPTSLEGLLLPSTFHLLATQYLVFHFKNASQKLPGFPLDMVKHHQTLLVLLIYDPSPLTDRAPVFWAKLLQAEEFFDKQCNQLTKHLWGEMPSETASFSQRLLRLRSTHVLTAWTGMQETARSVKDARVIRDRVFSILSNWMDHALELTANAEDETVSYEAAAGVAQPLFLMRGCDLLEWVKCCPGKTKRIVSILNCGSFYFAEAGLVMLDLNSVRRSSPAALMKEGPLEENLAESMVSNVLQELE